MVGPDARRSLLTAGLLAAALGAVFVVRTRQAPPPRRLLPDEHLAFSAGSPPAATASTPAALSDASPLQDAAPSPREDEASLMARMRAADPATVVSLARKLRRVSPDGALADERDSREVDALLALGKIQAAHARAQLFVQHYPNSPYATHVMNLMGVHPRPPGVVPELPDEPDPTQ